MKQNLNGVVFIDKPKALTSQQVVSKVKKILNINKAGHCGTLDPLATGLLIVLLGNTTRLAQFLITENKSYQVSFVLGQETDSWDADGEVISSSQEAVPQEVMPTKNAIVEACLSLNGVLQDYQVPPYSATKKNGKPLYAYARAGQNINPLYKPMKFYDIHIQKVQGAQVTAQVSCLKGGYIRSWVQTIGQKLGVGAHIQDLRRISSGAYSVEKALNLEELEIKGQKGICPIEDLDSLAQNSLNLILSFQEKDRLTNGLISYSLFQRLRPYQLELEQSALKERRVIFHQEGKWSAFVHLKAHERPQIEALLGV